MDIAFVTDRAGSFSIENTGWKLENAVCVELVRRGKVMGKDVFYYGQRGRDCDFVVAKDGRITNLLQVSYDISSKKVLNRELRGLVNAAEKFKCDKLTLVAFSDTEQLAFNGYVINVENAVEWFLRKERM